MPIRPENRYFYPIDWPQLSIAIRFGRAKGHCERCGRPHGEEVYHLGDGRWFDAKLGRWRDGKGRLIRAINTLPKPEIAPSGFSVRKTMVRTACAHLDQNTLNNNDRNLAALCQRCHLNHDRPWNHQRRRMTLLRRKALGDLFTGPYR